MTTDAGSQGSVVIPGFRPSVAEPSGQGFGDSPLLDSWQTGAGYYVKGGIGKSGKPWQRVYFRGIDVEPLEVVNNETYPFATAEMSIFYSDPEQTARRMPGQGINDWVALCDSLKDFYDEDQWDTMLEDCFGSPVSGDEGVMPDTMGKKFRLKKVPTLLRVGPNETNSRWHDEITLAYKVVEIDGMVSKNAGSNGTGAVNGAGGVDLQTHVLSLADGRTVDDFYSAAMNDSRVMENPSLVTSISQKTFVNAMVQQNKLTQDADGTLHVA